MYMTLNVIVYVECIMFVRLSSIKEKHFFYHRENVSVLV